MPKAFSSVYPPFSQKTGRALTIFYGESPTYLFRHRRDVTGYSICHAERHAFLRLIFLVDDTLLHHKDHAAYSSDVLDRVTVQSNDVGLKTRSDRTDLISQAECFGPE